MSERRRILFVAEAVTLAHVVRPLVLAKALDPAHYEVHFACAEGYEAFLEDDRFTRWSIHSIPPRRFQEALRKGTPLYDLNTLQDYLQEDLRVLDTVQPDMVVGDFRLSLAVSAPLRKIPYTALTNAHWSPYSTKSRAPFPEHPMGKVLGVTLASALFKAVEPLVFAIHARPLNRLRKRNGLPPLGGLREIYTTGDYTLYLDVPGLIPTHDLPPSHRYLGPLLWSPPLPLPAWWQELPNDRPCVYVTLGSSGAVELLPTVLDAMEELPVSVLVATAGRSDIGPLDGRRWVADYLPGSEAARRADLVISNGGSATTYQALAEGVPVLGIPFNMDQFYTQNAVVEAGAGVLLRSGQVRKRRRRKCCRQSWPLHHTARLLSVSPPSSNATTLPRTSAHF